MPSRPASLGSLAEQLHSHYVHSFASRCCTLSTRHECICCTHQWMIQHPCMRDCNLSSVSFAALMLQVVQRCI